MSYFGLTKNVTLSADCAQYQLLVEQENGTFAPTTAATDGADLKVLGFAASDASSGEEVGLIMAKTAKGIASGALDRFAVVAPADDGELAAYAGTAGTVGIGRITKAAAEGDVVEILVFTPYIIGA